jgi:hypothetical protein
VREIRAALLAKTQKHRTFSDKRQRMQLCSPDPRKVTADITATLSISADFRALVTPLVPNRNHPGFTNPVCAHSGRSMLISATYRLPASMALGL